MSDIVFHPYIGIDFRQAPRRLLLVGESHYGEPHDDPAQSTSHVVDMWLNREWSVRYLTIAARILTGLPGHQIDRQAVMKDVAFYNYIQVSMPEIRVRPSHEQAVASQKAFQAVLENLDPTHVLVTGSIPWRHIEAVHGSGAEITIEGVTVPSLLLPTGSGHAVAIRIAHLSRASAKEWMVPVSTFLALPVEGGRQIDGSRPGLDLQAGSTMPAAQ